MTKNITCSECYKSVDPANQYCSKCGTEVKIIPKEILAISKIKKTEEEIFNKLTKELYPLLRRLQVVSDTLKEHKAPRLHGQTIYQHTICFSKPG